MSTHSRLDVMTNISMHPMLEMFAKRMSGVFLIELDIISLHKGTEHCVTARDYGADHHDLMVFALQRILLLSENAA